MQMVHLRPVLPCFVADLVSFATITIPSVFLSEAIRQGFSIFADHHRLRSAKLKQHGVVEDIDYQDPRGLDRKLMRTLAGSEWVRQH